MNNTVIDVQKFLHERHLLVGMKLNMSQKGIDSMTQAIVDYTEIKIKESAVEKTIPTEVKGKDVWQNKADDMVTKFLEYIPDSIPNTEALEIAKKMSLVCIREIDSIEGLPISTRDYYSHLEKLITRK